MVDSRLETIYEEASKLFINKGYARTQISYIANAAGISIGSIYTLFTSKKTIFDFVLKCTVDSDYMESTMELPIKDSDFTSLQDEILKLCEEINRNFGKHLCDDDDCYHFVQMLSDVFDIITRYGVGFLIFQSNGSDSGVLYTYYVEFRKSFCENLEKYVCDFMKKNEIRMCEFPKYHARLILETLSWWGMHVKYDAFETNTRISQEVAKKVALDALLHAYAI
jgi:AcrR family transcriptional regulator